MHIIIPALGPGPHCIETIQCESTLPIYARHATAMDRTTGNCTDRRLSDSPNDRQDGLRMRRERERTGSACLRNARMVPSAERARQGQAEAEHGCRENVSIGQRAVEYNVRGWLHRREENQATEEGCQADPVSRSTGAQKRQHKRTQEDDFAYCLMHASLNSHSVALPQARPTILCFH